MKADLKANMKYKDYKVVDFTLDEDFIQWVKNPKPDSDIHWKRVMETYPHKKEEIMNARRMILSVLENRDSLSNTQRETLKTELWRQIELAETEEEEKNKESINWSQWYKIAAVFVGLVSFIVIMVIPRFHKVEYQTRMGETKIIILPDQSKVTLNGNSRLSYSSSWTVGESREVWLDGEGFFSIIKGSRGEKFKVHSGKIIVEVLGTKFNVNNRRKKIQVVLESGKVKLDIESESKSGQMRSILMTPGELVEFNKFNQNLKKEKVKSSNFTSWKENLLVFDRTPLSEVFEKIEDTFGYQVILSNKALSSKLYTDTSPADDLDLLLEKLITIYNIKIDKKGNTLMIN